jgi:hypothetical protein
MTSIKPDRKAKLAAALKQNLKRRKTGTADDGKDNNSASQDLGMGAGIARQMGLKAPSARPKTASKRN